MTIDQSVLGKKTTYDAHYDPNKLFPIARSSNREKIGIHGVAPFFGYDLWDHYEVSWLNANGVPRVALAEMIYACDSPFLIESKSMKLYFNSFNNTRVPDVATLQKMITDDLSQRIGADVVVNIVLINKDMHEEKLVRGFQGICIDDVDIQDPVFQLDATLLKTGTNLVEETLYSDLLKSNCLMTSQPDWCSVQIHYRGKQILHESLLRYIISYRNSNEFSETCIERIFMDIMRQCAPQQLTVYGRTTRRGGIDINPYRSTEKIAQPVRNERFCRQ